MSIHIHYIEAGGTVDDEQALEQFQKQWAIYQKVVDHTILSLTKRWRQSSTTV